VSKPKFPHPITLAEAQADLHKMRRAEGKVKGFREIYGRDKHQLEDDLAAPVATPWNDKLVIEPRVSLGFTDAPAGDGVNGARKMDVGKAPVVQGFMQYFPRAINAVAMVSEYGARKYNDGGYSVGWQSVPNGLGRYHDAEGRHITKAALEDYDAESELAHLAHGAWNAMAALELALLTGEVTLRQGNQVVDGAPVLGTFKELKL
jgi:hypothetical protein